MLEEKYYEQLNKMPKEAAALAGPFRAPRVDEEGYSLIQLGQLMQYFGEYMHNENPNLPFDVNIKISDEYLVEHTPETARVR